MYLIIMQPRHRSVYLCFDLSLHRTLTLTTARPRDNKTYFVLNAVEHEIFFANKYENANNSWHFIFSAPASPLWRGGPPLLPFPAAPLPFLSRFLSYFNSRHKTLHFGENFVKIGPKLKMLSMFKGQCSVYSIF